MKFDITKLPAHVQSFVGFLKGWLSDEQIEAIGEHQLTEQANLTAGVLNKAAAVTSDTEVEDKKDDEEEGGKEEDDGKDGKRPMGTKTGADDGQVPIGQQALPAGTPPPPRVKSVAEVLTENHTELMSKFDALDTALSARIKAIEDVLPTLVGEQAVAAAVAPLEAANQANATDIKEIQAGLGEVRVGLGEAKRAADAYEQLTKSLVPGLPRQPVKPNPAMKQAADQVDQQTNDEEPMFTGVIRMRPE